MMTTLNTTAATTGLVMNVSTRRARPVPTISRNNHVGVASSTSGGMKNASIMCCNMCTE